MWIETACDTEVMETGRDGHLILGDARRIPEGLADELEPFTGQVQCVYIDPPFLTGDIFHMKMRVGDEGASTGKPYVLLPAYCDRFESRQGYLDHVGDILKTAVELLHETGTLFLHVDSRTSPYFRLMLDDMLGEKQFVNEIVWAYQTGGRALGHFSRKHDTILMYRKSPHAYFNIRAVPVSREANRANHMKRRTDENGRAYRTITSGGKTYTYYDDDPVYPSDVWADVSHLQQKDPQRTGYDTQKPVSLLERIILSTTRPGDLCADLCCGSGTALVAAAQNGRRFLGVDNGAAAMAAARKRLIHTQATVKWPAQPGGMPLKARVNNALGFYEVTLEDFALTGSEEKLLQKVPPGFSLKALDSVDQWACGLYKEGAFYPYAQAARTPSSPKLNETLQVPMFRGQVALMVVDIMCRKHFYVWQNA